MRTPTLLPAPPVPLPPRPSMPETPPAEGMQWVRCELCADPIEVPEDVPTVDAATGGHGWHDFDCGQALLVCEPCGSRLDADHANACGTCARVTRESEDWV